MIFDRGDLILEPQFAFFQTLLLQLIDYPGLPPRFGQRRYRRIKIAMLDL